MLIVQLKELVIKIIPQIICTKQSLTKTHSDENRLDLGSHSINNQVMVKNQFFNVQNLKN